MKNNLRSVLRRPLAALAAATGLAALFLPPSGRAATLYWDNSGGTADDWQSLANWSTVIGGGANPASLPTGTDLAEFSATSVIAPQAVNLNGEVAVAGLSFTSGQAHSLLGGNADHVLTLGGSGITKTGTGAVTIGSATPGQQVAIALATDQIWSNNDNSTALTVLNGVSASTEVNRILTLSGTSTAANTIGGILADNGAGVLSLVKSGTGTWALSNTGNTYSGGLTINPSSGTVVATTNTGTNASGLGTGPVSIGAGSTLDLLSSNTVTATTTLNNTITGTGLLKLTFTNSLTNTNTILNGLSGFAGTIQLSNTGANGDKLNTNNNYGNLAASLVIDNGSQLFVTNNSTTNFAGGISIIGTGNTENRGVIRLAASVLGGNISLAGDSTIGLEGGYLTGNISAGVAGTQTLTFGGSQSGNGTLSGALSDGAGTLALTKNNSGTLWLTGASTFTGATTIAGGRLQLGLGGTTGSLSPSSPISVAAGASLTFNRSNAMALGTDFGAISGAGNVQQHGTGTTTFAPSATMDYTGQTQVNRGTLTLDFANMATPTNLVNASSVLNLGGGTLSVLGKTGAATAQAFASTTLSAGRSVLAPAAGAGSSTTVTLGALTSNAGSAIHFTPATAWAAGGAGTPGPASTTEIVTVSSVTRNGTAIPMPGAGSYVFIGANAFNGTGSGARYVVARGAASGPYQLAAMPTSSAFVTTGGSSSTIYNIGGAQTLTGNTVAYALIGNSAGAAALANAGFSYTLNGFLNAQTGTITMSGTGKVIIGGEKDLVVNNANTGGLTISSVIENNGPAASSVTNSSTGTGLLTLSGANTYTGGTFFNSGTTVITSDGAANAAAQLGTVPAAATAGNLTFNGGTLRLSPTATMTLNANRGIALGAGGGTINLTTAQQANVNSIIAGVGGLTLSNTSTSTLAIGGVNTYTGGTTISGTGLIVPVNVASPFGVGGVLTLNGGQMRATTAGNVTIANPVNIAADTTFPTLASEKSLIFNGPTVLSGTRTLTTNVGATVAGTTVQFSNGISESTAGSGLTKAGTGVLTLGGLNTFTGPTNITGGRLAYTKTFALYANNPASWTDTNITVANGATMMLSVGGTNEFTTSDVATIAALGSPTGGFQSGSTLGLNTASGDFTAGAIANPNAGANSLNLLKIGANTLTLNGNNTYTGTTTIQGGTVIANGSSTTSQININGGTNTTLLVTNPGATGTGSFNVQTGATTPSLLFRLDGGGIIPLPNSFIGNSGITTNIDVNNNGTGTNGVVQLNGIPATGLGNVTLNITGGNGYSLHIASVFSSAGGAGTTLVNPTTANVTFGDISSIANTAAYNWQLDGTSTGNAVTGAITNGTGTISITKANTSTWTLSGNSSYTGPTTVNAGTLILSGSSDGTSAVTVNAGGTLQLDYTANSSKINDLAPLTLGGGTLDLTGGSHTEIVASTTLTANTASRVTRSTPGSVLQMGTITWNAGASIDFSAPNIATTDNTNTNGILGTWATIGGTDWATNSTNAAGGLITATTYTDVQRQTAGTIANGPATNVRIVEGSGSNNITLGAATTTINTLTQSASGGGSAATIDPAGQTLATDGILVGTGAGALTIGTGTNNGNLTTATAAGDLALINNTANGFTIRSVIADNFGSSLTKAGTGPLTLTGANTYAFGTNLAAGTLILGHGGALGTGTLTLSGGNLDSSVANLVNTNDNPQAWNANFTFVGSQNLDLGLGNVTLSATRQVTVAANTLTVGGDIAGAGGLTKTGPGNLTLSGANTYTGATAVSAGILTLSGIRTATATGGFNVGNLAGSTGTLNLTDGTFTVGAAGSNFLIGSAAGGIGIMNQSGGSLTTIGNQLLIGNLGGTGTYNLSGGTLTTIAGTLGVTVGVNTGSTATFNLSDSGFLSMPATSTLQITRSDNSAASGVTGTFNQTGGTANVGILQMGGSNTTPANNANANATLNLTGGIFTAQTFTQLSGANNSSSIINIGGTADVTLPAFPTARGTGSTATINFDGGTLRSTAASATYMGGLTNAFIKAGGANFDLANNITITQALLTDPVSTGGGLTKAGTGTLTLTGANTYTGKTIVSAGGLSFNTIDNVGAAATALGAPATVANGTIDLSGTLTYTGAAAAATDRVINLTDPGAGSTINNSGGGLLTLNGNFTGDALNLGFRGAGDITVNGLIPATHFGTVSHTDAGTLTLTNPNNAWTGSLDILKGIVSVAAIANQGVASPIGAGTSIILGQSGFNNTGTLQFTGLSGGSSDRDINIQSNGTNGNGGIIENTVAGQLLTLSGNITVGGSGTLPSLGLTGAGDGLLSNPILGSPALAVTKSGAGTWTISGANTYTGNTIIDQGTLTFTEDQNLAGGLVFGSSSAVTTAGTLDLSTVSATFGGALNVRTNSADVNVINIGASETLSVGAGMSVGVSPAATGRTTKLTATGGGALSVGGAASVIDIGMPNSDQNAAQNSTTVDFTGLSSFSANVNEFRVGHGSRNAATLLGSNTANSITANFLRVGNSTGDNAGSTLRLTLGSGTNVINASTIQLGFSKANATIAFDSQTAGSPGTLTLRGTAGGTSTADMTLGSNNGTATGTTATGTLDLRGHVVDVLAGTVNLGIANQTSTGGGTGRIYFDTGTFAVNSLILGTKSNTGGGVARGILEVGGGSFTVNSGGSVTLGSQTGSGSSVATVTLTGGTFTSNVDIVAGTGTTTSTITLNGGTLDMTGMNIGGATAIDSLELQSGTLRNVAEINNGGAIAKTTAGTLTIEGSNTWTGATSVNEGTLVLAGGSSVSNSALTVADGATLNVTGTGTVGTVSTGALIFANNSITTADLRTSGTPAADLINLGGALSIGTGVQLNLTTLAGDTLLPIGTRLVLMNYGGFSFLGGAFDNKPNLSVFSVGANQWQINYADADAVTLTSQGAAVAPYDTWAAAQTPPLAAGSQQGDADGDGVKNYVEFATDGNPNDPKNIGKSFGRMIDLAGDVNGPTLVFTIAVRVDDNSVFTGATTKAAERDGINYEIQASTDLGTWTTIVVTDVTGNSAIDNTGLPTLTNSGWQYRSFRTPGDRTTDPRKFFRSLFTVVP